MLPLAATHQVWYWYTMIRVAGWKKEICLTKTLDFHWWELSPCEIAWYFLIHRDSLACITYESLILTGSKARNSICCNSCPGRPRNGLTDLLYCDILSLNCWVVFPLYWASFGQIGLSHHKRGGNEAMETCPPPYLSKNALCPGYSQHILYLIHKCFLLPKVKEFFDIV